MTRPSEPVVAGKKAPALDIRALLKQHEGRNYELHAAHVNPSNVRTLKTIGFDRCYVRAEGPYLWDVNGEKYLDMLSGYGVFGLGRNHRDQGQGIEEARLIRMILNADQIQSPRFELLRQWNQLLICRGIWR